MSQCTFCNNVFSSTGAMVSHQKRAKYCIEIQQKSNLIVGINKSYCQYCNKSFTRIDVKNKHETLCKDNNEYLLEIIDGYKIKGGENDSEIKRIKQEKDSEIRRIKEEKDSEIRRIKEEKDSEIRRIKEEIFSLKTKLERETTRGNIFEKLYGNEEECVKKIALQPKTNSTATNTLNIPQFNITLEQLTQAAMDNFDENLFLQGQIGAAKFFLEYVKNSNNGVLPWLVADKSREILKFKGEDKEVVVDPKAKRITQLVSDALKLKNQEHYDNIYKSIK